MVSSPRTPTRRRKSSAHSSQSIDLAYTSQSPQSTPYTPDRSSHSRKSSLYSVPSPSTPRPGTSHSRNGDFGASGGSGSALGSANGLGSLADELAEAYSDEDEGEPEEGLSWDQVGEIRDLSNGHGQEEDIGIEHGKAQNNGILNSPNPGSAHDVSTPRQSASSKHRRKQSRYNRSINDDTSDLEETDAILPSLEARIATIESLAKEATTSNNSEADAVVKRVAESLKDLGSQSGVETGTSRLVTAHNALTSHLTTQTRLLQTLSQTLFSPLSLPPETPVIDPLLPSIATLLLHLPLPDAKPLAQLHTLQSSTTDLITTLSLLSDTLYMTRQTTSLAARRLRASREMVAELRREGELSEEGVRWVEKGGWEERLRGRECARVCGEVVGGFEEVCRGWRERLVGGGEMMAGVEVAAG